MLRFRIIAGAALIAAGGLYGVSYGWTCAGSENETNETGNYPLGCPMGGIGAGNFNFLPSGQYNQNYIRVSSDGNAAPTCYAFQKRATTTITATLQHGSGSITTTYTAYWPTVHMQYHQSTLLDSIALDCFSPIITGDGIASDNMHSSLPLAYYFFTITNNSTSTDTAAIALYSSSAATTMITAGGKVRGVKGSAVCIMVDTTELYTADSTTYGNSSTFTNGLLNGSTGGYVAKRVIVGANSSRTIKFVVSWTNVSDGYYRNYFTDAQTLATYAIDSADILKAKVDRWHNKILNSNLPAWLQDLVINSLHVYNCMTDWTTATTSGVAGTYGMAESMSSGNYGTNDQAYHSHFALPLFLPQAAWSQVARMGASQLSSGLFGHLYGNTDIRSDVGQKFILETYKDYQWTGNTAQLQARYAQIKLAVSGIEGEDSQNDGLTDDNAQTTYDNPFSDGWTFPSKEFDNELYLAALKAAKNAAVVNGTPADTATYNTNFTQTSAGFERANNATYASSGYWNTTNTSSGGHTGYYTGSSNISGGALSKGTSVWDGALMGQWCADVCGLGPLHQENRIESMLDFIYDACLDHRNPPCYALMMSYANNNCTGATPTSTYFQNTAVTYCSYPAGDLCAAFGHNKPDYGMRALHAFWNDMFSKYLRVFNMPCKMTIAGNGEDWGLDRYMNPPACFAALFAITGFTIDVNAKILRLKPSLPTSTQYILAGDSLKAAPLMNPISCGTVDYKNLSAATPHPYQSFRVYFDNPMTFNTFYTKKLYSQLVQVRKPAGGGSVVAATIAVNSADTSEYAVSFGSTLTIDANGVLIGVGTDTVPAGTASGTRYAEPEKINQLGFTADMKRGTLSYVLPQRMKVNLSVVNARGVTVMRFESEESAGRHVVQHDWAHTAPGVYYAYLRAGERTCIKKLVYVR